MRSKIINLIKRKVNLNSPIVKKLINGMAWNVIGIVLSKAFIMIASIITARILGADKNGEFSIINNTIIMFSTFAGLGLGTTATRFVAEYKIKNKEKCGRIIGVTYLFGFVSGCLMAIVLLISAPWLATEQLNASHLESGLRLASVLLVANTINTIQISVLSGFEDFKSIGKLSIIQGVISFPILILSTQLYEVNGLILGNIIISLIMVILYAIKNNNIKKNFEVFIDIRVTSKELHILWKFSLPSMLSNVMVGPIIWIGNTFITSTANGYFELGIFNAANQWRNLLIFIPTAIGNVILPVIIANRREKHLERINILLGWVIVITIAIPLLTFPELITFLYGNEYMGKSFNISILMVILTSCILSYRQGISRNIISKNLMWWGFLDNSIWGIIFILVVWFLRDLGAIGLSISYVVAYIINTIVFVPFYIKKGVVHKSLIISKTVLLMWFALFIQMIGTVVSSNVCIRVLSALFSMLALCLVIKLMFKKSKNDSCNESNT